MSTPLNTLFRNVETTVLFTRKLDFAAGRSHEEKYQIQHIDQDSFDTIHLDRSVTAEPESNRRYDIFPAGMTLSSRYRVLEHIGRGGFGNVYLVEDLKSYLEERFVVKIPEINEAPDQFVKRLRSQLKKWKLLSNTDPDRIVKLLQVEQIEVKGVAAVGIFMEYMAGGDLLHHAAVP